MDLYEGALVYIPLKISSGGIGIHPSPLKIDKKGALRYTPLMIDKLRGALVYIPLKISYGGLWFTPHPLKGLLRRALVSIYIPPH